MARRSVADDQPMYRVVVVRRARRDNPDWERGNIDTPRFLWDGAEYTTTYGPYNSPGTARGQLTHHTTDSWGNAPQDIVSGHIEQAAITWKRVR